MPAGVAAAVRDVRRYQEAPLPKGGVRDGPLESRYAMLGRFWQFVWYLKLGSSGVSSQHVMGVNRARVRVDAGSWDRRAGGESAIGDLHSGLCELRTRWGASWRVLALSLQVTSGPPLSLAPSV